MSRASAPLCAIVLLLVASASSPAQAQPQAQASALLATSVHGSGPVDLSAQDAVLQASPANGAAWDLAARHVRVVLVDDRRDLEVEHPLAPGELLFGDLNRTVRTLDFRDARIRVGLAGDADATMIFLPDGKPLAVAATEPGTFRVDPMGQQVLERSHAFGSNATPTDLDYEILQPASLAISLSDLAQSRIDGTLQAYAWGAVVEVEAQGETRVLRTGAYREAAPGSPVGTSHFVHAFLRMSGAQVTVSGPARLHSASLEASSLGETVYGGATGEVQTSGGPVPVANATLGTTAGSYAWSAQGDRVQVDVLQPPTQWRGAAAAVQPAASAEPWALWVGAAGLGLAGALYVAPAAQGGLVARGVHGRGWRGLRTEGYALWAAWSDTRGMRRLAAFCAGRAARNSPMDGDARMEYGTLLHEARRHRKAVREHGRADRLFAMGPPSGNLGLNAYRACLSCLELGRLRDAVAWLQRACEADPAFGDAAARDPALRRLRSHPDFPAVVGRGVNA